eukprot:m.196452 g.196452  ORF g.196452 m.196452 type:complete len:597 (+) comp10086_c0_seq2:105-1895(+)
MIPWSDDSDTQDSDCHDYSDCEDSSEDESDYLPLAVGNWTINQPQLHLTPKVVGPALALRDFLLRVPPWNFYEFSTFAELLDAIERAPEEERRLLANGCVHWDPPKWRKRPPGDRLSAWSCRSVTPLAAALMPDTLPGGPTERVAAVRRLAAMGADMNLPSDFRRAREMAGGLYERQWTWAGFTPLSVALECLPHEIEVLCCLLELGADANLAYSEKECVLEFVDRKSEILYHFFDIPPLVQLLAPWNWCSTDILPGPPADGARGNNIPERCGGVHVSLSDEVLAAARLLLEHGASPDAPFDQGYEDNDPPVTLLQHAIGFLNRPLIEALLSLPGVSLDTAVANRVQGDRVGGPCSLIMNAVADGNVDACELLLSLGADPSEVRDATVHQHSFRMTTSRGTCSAEFVLEATGPAVAGPSPLSFRVRVSLNGWTALHVAVSMSLFKEWTVAIIKFLHTRFGCAIEARVDVAMYGTWYPEETDPETGEPIRSDSSPALVLAALLNHVYAMEALLACGAVVDSRTVPMQRTPLHFACGPRGSHYAARLLCDHGASRTARDAAGNTPLHFAASLDDIGVARMLLERNAAARKSRPLGTAT